MIRIRVYKLDLDLSVIDANLLPPQMRMIARAIGLPEMFRLIQARGGTLLRVPLHPDRARVLIQIITPDSIRRLCEEFGDQVLELPKADKILVQLRNHAIRAERESASLSQVALRYRLTRRHVINITHDTSDDGQLDLFDPS